MTCLACITGMAWGIPKQSTILDKIQGVPNMTMKYAFHHVVSHPKLNGRFGKKFEAKVNFCEPLCSYVFVWLCMCVFECTRSLSKRYISYWRSRSKKNCESHYSRLPDQVRDLLQDSKEWVIFFYFMNLKIQLTYKI